MILKLVLKGLQRGKARFACAFAGIAASAGAVIFMFSFAATNAAQAPALAGRAVRPWTAWHIDGQFGAGRRTSPAQALQRPARRSRADKFVPAGELELSLVAMSIDHRPGGRVLQGPPLRAVLALAPDGNPYDAAPLVEGRWPSATAAENEIVCTVNTLKRFGRGAGASLGDTLKFVGRTGTMSARIVGLLAETKLPMGFPNVFANPAAYAKLSAEPHGTLRAWRTPPQGVSELLTPQSPSVVAAFTGDEQRKLDYARPLLLIAAVLTALALLYGCESWTVKKAEC